MSRRFRCRGRGWAITACALLGWVSVACSKDPAERRPWDGPTRVIHLRQIEPKPASETDFNAVRFRRDTFDLTVPVDWKQGSKSDKTLRDNLHKWQWIWPLLAAYETTKDKSSLAKAIEIVFDWIRQNPITANDPESQGWQGSNPAWRAQAIGYAFRAGVEAGLLDEEHEEQLLKTSREHAVWLLSDEHYGQNAVEGQLQDYGLAVLCAQLNKIRDCNAWRDIAAKRFANNVGKMTSQKSAFYLSHSPDDHFDAVERVAKMAELVKDRGLASIERRMRESAGWLVPPDGKQLLLGTSRSKPVPKWANEEAKLRSGMSPLDDVGWSVVKQGDSYLIASAAHHPRSFKQADELTFSWSERGLRLISDTGFHSYSAKSPESRFANSSRAHNTLTVDRQNFAPSKPYGSAIQAVGEDAGWYVIIANNPSLSKHQVAHERLWLYRPGEWLIVVDKVGSPRKRTYDRFFHFWHEREVQLSEQGLARAKLKDSSVHIKDFSEAKVDSALIREQDKPMQGYMYVNNKKARPNQVLRLTSEMDRAVYAVAFRVGTELPEKLSVAFDSERGYHVELGDQVLALKRDGQKVRFEPVARVEPGAEKEASKPVDAAGEKLEATGKEATQPSAPEGSAAPATSAR